MIECPICHVKNAADARFCAECGQRLVGPAQPPAEKPSEASPAAQVSQAPVARLHSPLLEGDSDDPPAAQKWQAVDRFKQLASHKPPERPAAMPDTPYKNPFDPRNSQTAPEASPAQPATHRPRLRSPLLGGNQDEEGEAMNPTEKAAFEEDEQAHSGGGLRSPLLGGPYAGTERRQEKTKSDASFGGHERRRGLHSPMLDDNYAGADYIAEEEETPIDEDDPTVLRSPLLAARRPVSDRPAAAPTASNLQTPTRPANAPEAMQVGNKPAPSDSFTSLRRLGAGTNLEATALPPAPQSLPRAPASAAADVLRQPLSGAQPAARPALPVAAAAGDGYTQAMADTPEIVPPAFQNVQTAAPQSLGKAEPAWTAPPAARGTAAGITVQPPQGTGSEPVLKPPAARRSRFAAADEDDAAIGQSPPVAPTKGGALLPVFACVLGVILLVKVWVVISVFSSDWRNYAFLVVDQLIGLALIVCILLMCLARKNS